MTATPPPVEEAPPVDEDTFVPVDQRVLGFDRRTAWPGIVVLVIWFVWAFAMPFISDRIEFDNSTQAGDVVDLGSGLTLTPVPGWNLEDGVLTSEDTRKGVGLGSATLTQEQITMDVKTAGFSGTPEELLDQLLEVNQDLGEIRGDSIGDRVPFTTADGTAAVLAPFTGVEEQGLLATYVFDGTGVEVVVIAGADADPQFAEDVAAMVRSISSQTTSTGGGGS